MKIIFTNASLLAVFLLCLMVGTSATHASSKKFDGYLVKLQPNEKERSEALQTLKRMGSVNVVAGDWVSVRGSSLSLNKIKNAINAVHVEKNRIINLFDFTKTRVLPKNLSVRDDYVPAPDNPAIPPRPDPSNAGNDPLLNNQWGMIDNNVQSAWTKAGSSSIVVAVIDTGVDYTHEDLLEVMWRNPNEILGNNIDDDNNGYIDDIFGWDFHSNDNKPYDLTTPTSQILNGGNPGHGTHCAGNVAAKALNGKGIAGVGGVNNISIMALRIFSEKGQATAEGIVKAIHYAANNGAKISSNSWGYIGDDGNADARAIKEAVTYAQSKETLFVVAAGNGNPRTGIGYDNDTNSKPAYPASYDHDAILSVAAIDVTDKLGKFSNWGARSVDIGAPGVTVFSTVPGQRYTDLVIDLTQYGFGKIMWDGTSMATPHVAGAAALYWSKNPNATWREVKAAVISSAEATTTLRGKVVSGGKLNAEALMNLK